MKKQFIVIGLGRFGSSVVKTLAAGNADVLAVDIDEEKVDDVSDYATHAVSMDATDENALKALGIRNFDVAIVCVGDIQSSVLITLICKELGVKYVLCKAQDELHAKVLFKIGADKIIFPERDTAIRVANNLLASNLIDFIEIFKNYGMLEIAVPNDWVGKSLLELNIRKNYNVSIIAIKRGDDFNVNPSADDTLKGGDVVIVIGSEDNMNKIKKSDSIKKE
jgi:trk system potassium uptake protein TrkA